jgi:hypothetical protein
MKLRCKPGDLAIVIHDTPPCAANIGRIVMVRGPLKVNRTLRLPCWLIKPVRPVPYLVEIGNTLNEQIVNWSSRVEHPDAWLLPISGLKDEVVIEDSLDLDQNTLSLNQEIPAAVTAAKPLPQEGTAAVRGSHVGTVLTCGA